MNKSKTKEKLKNSNSEKSLRIVGIGASAGGLEALQQMVSNLPQDTGLSFIVAQHLSPSYKSMMVDLLEKDATLPVYAPKNLEQIKPNTIYICPPNYNIEINEQDKILLTTYTENRHTPRPSVDMLFESIAIAKGENAIGIVLSGTGSDGARGIRAIKGEGGFGIAQDPNTAKYDGMPNSAINSSNVDLILSPEEIGFELKNLLKFSRTRSIEIEHTLPRELYNAILRKLKHHFKIDFALYKETTIIRRIERRMTALKISKVEKYLNHMNENENEVHFLFNDMLIGVTSFFRDFRAFETLHSELKHYIYQKDNKVIRIWVPGCSTGEEAYSIAMILSEVLGDKVEEYKIQIFATDIDKRSIEFARNGRYPESALQNLPKPYRQKYFVVTQDQFEVIKPIKANVIFSEHDVTSDPPFLRLDLVSCRNLLIYFNLELQRQIMPVFHYALNPKGLLFLGQSESIGVFQEQFRAVSKSAKLYEAVFLGKKMPPDRTSPRRTIADYKDIQTPLKKTGSQKSHSRNEDLTQLISEAIHHTYLPNAILVNENMDIVFLQGKNPLLIRPEGVPTNNIYRNLHPSLSVDLRSTLHLIESGQTVANTGFQKIELNGEHKWARLILIDIPHQPGFGRLILIFGQVEDELDLPLISTNGQSGISNDLLSKEQERQLIRTKEQLQSVIEELETSNEEMQSMNEELQSSNEELQSSNEELETTNEELQSTNEELQTAYAELRVAYEDKEIQQKALDELKDQLALSNNLLEDAEKVGKMGSWMWNIQQSKMTWSKGSYALFGLSSEVFHPSYEAFVGLAHPDDRKKLEEHITNLLTHHASGPFHFRAYDRNKKILWISLDAFVSFNNLKQAEKMIGNLKNITDQVQNKAHISEQDQRIAYLMNHSLNGSYIYDFTKNQTSYINPAYSMILGYHLDDVHAVQHDNYLEFIHPDDRAKAQQHIEKVKQGRIGQTYPLTYRIKYKQSDKYIWVNSNETPYSINPETGEVLSMFGTFTEAKPE